jgi:hypothetical protein
MTHRRYSAAHWLGTGRTVLETEPPIAVISAVSHGAITVGETLLGGSGHGHLRRLDGVSSR